MDFISKFIEEQANLSKQFDVASAKSVSEFDILHNTFCSFEKDINDFNDISIVVKYYLWYRYRSSILH